METTTEKCQLCAGEGLVAGDCHRCGKRKLIPGKQPIREEDGLQKQWFEEAKAMTLEKLPAFLQKLTAEYQHDYGTICHAISAAAVAAAWAVEHSPAGGITGFQSGFVMWDFIKEWQGIEGPMRLLQFKDLLFPQYANHFAKCISADSWKWLQEEAKKNLAKPREYVAPSVVAHWESIVAGHVPFGFAVVDE